MGAAVSDNLMFDRCRSPVVKKIDMQPIKQVDATFKIAAKTVTSQSKQNELGIDV